MNEQDKQLLLKDLCARLPYGTKVCYRLSDKDKYTTETLSGHMLDYFNENSIIEVKPYLRPMSSMTEKEYDTFPIPYTFDSFSTWNNTILSEVIEGTQILIDIDEITEIIDWLNAHYFDYSGLIKKGLALEAPEGMYNN